MNREILFRGKDLANKWLYGAFVPAKVYLGYDSDSAYIEVFSDFEKESKIFWVDIKTVGQYTGRKDKNGAKIFEGDILEFSPYDGETCLYAVEWNERKGAFEIRMLEFEAETDSMDFWDSDYWSWEIIGNIYDNPELLGGGENG